LPTFGSYHPLCVGLPYPLCTSLDIGPGAEKETDWQGCLLHSRKFLSHILLQIKYSPITKTSGTSNIADRPISKTFSEPNYPLSDENDIFSYLKSRDSAVPYAQRTSDIVVTEVGNEYGVKTYILMSPSLYGIGTDPLHEFCHTPTLIRKSLLIGNTPVVGDGAGNWDNLHILDMARAYKLVLSKILSGAGADIPNGKDGIYFLQDGHHTWLELSQMVANAGFKAGALKSIELKHLNLKEAASLLAGGKYLLAEIGWASK
jgi:nucleoside-diphosphate-sugar epimerase